jgi:Mg/Co/Ni transporter MgtE
LYIVKVTAGNYFSDRFLIDRMTPGQAADVLSVLTLEDQTEIMNLMNEENLDKITSILKKRQDTILNLITEEIS